MENTEIEVRFLEVNVSDLKQKLIKLGAHGGQEKFLSEVIMKGGDDWMSAQRRVRVRSDSNQTTLTYKEGNGEGMHMTEYEISVSDYETTVQLMQASGLSISRKQEKYRISYTLGDCIIDIDTWPGIPTYVEVEGPSVSAIKECAMQLGFEWNSRYEKDALWLIRECYGLNLHEITDFTFDNYPDQLVLI